MKKEYFECIINSIDTAIAEHEMIYDEMGNPVDYRFLFVNDKCCQNFSLERKDLIGKTAFELFPHTDLDWVEKFSRVVETGMPISFISYSKELNHYYSVYARKTGATKFVTTFKDITDYVKASAPESKYDIISNLFTEGKTAYFEFDLRKKKFDYSENMSNIIGMNIITYKDYVDMFTKYIHPADQEAVTKVIDSMFHEDVNEIAMQTRFYNQDKQDYIWISYFAYIEERYRKVPVKIKGLIKDITEEKEEFIHNERMNRMFRETRKIASIATFYYNLNDDKFNSSEELNEFLGVKQINSIEDIRRIVHPEDLAKYDTTTNIIHDNLEGLKNEYRIIKNNEIRYIQSSVFGEVDKDGEILLVFGILKDVTELESSKREIEYFANHDVLTGLYNRNNFELYSKTLNAEDKYGLLICDVDGLKLINDAFGHIEGDELLITLAKTLHEVAPTDKIFRIGGDEFIIVLQNATEEQMLQIQNDIKTKIRTFKLHTVGFGASIGYAFVDELKTFEDTFRLAENLMYQRKLTERKSRKSNALATIMQTMHEKTEETEEHCIRVGELAGELLKLSGRKRDTDIEEIKLIANVHDIGKISISDKILTKPGRLEPLEYERIKYHSESGYKIITNIIDNEDIAIAVLYHHERYDGTGYPHGLKGEEIPLYSRIIAICDAYDAMTSDRVYRKAFTREQALQEIKDNAGTQFDPVLVARFLEIV